MVVGSKPGRHNFRTRCIEMDGRLIVVDENVTSEPGNTTIVIASSYFEADYLDVSGCNTPRALIYVCIILRLFSRRFLFTF